MVDFDEQIAEASLRISSIKLSPEKPFQWASVYFMPIYNDNRMNLRYPENRRLITDAFVDIIQRNNIKVEIIAGISTAGIAPAASLAQRLNVPIGITDGKKAEVYSSEWVKTMSAGAVGGDYDLVVSTCPDSIIPGVFVANGLNLPFAYVREKPKTHGTQQQIEGIVKEGDRVLFLDYHKEKGKSYLEKAVEAVVEKGARIIDTISTNTCGGDVTFPDLLEGYHGLLVEDLVSFAGSSIDELNFWRNVSGGVGKGLIINDCVSIFSYGFAESLDRFRQANCNLHSALVYNRLLQTAVKTGAIRQDQQELLIEWRGDYKNWGEKHGFPPVKKESK